VSLLDYQLSDGIATITLDDGKVNALSLEMQAAIGAAIDRAEADDAAIVLTGRPGMFSAGFDLATIGGGGAAAGEMVIGGFRLAQRLLTHPRPVVVGCTGHAIAMGTFLMFAADYRVGPEAGSYRWIANEVAIGLTMPRAAIEMLRFRLTPGAVDKAVILSHAFGPADVLSSGYFDEVVPLEDVVATATERARAALGLDARAHAQSKLRTRGPALDALARAIDEDEGDFARWLAESAG
jgi:enoyl-CoA hydratase